MSGFKGYEIHFPVIRVKDKGKKGHIHIVGADSHDTLYIDRKTKGIHYYNLKNGEGTQGDYAFVGEENEYSGELQIEFVSFDELMEIYKAEKQLAVEHEDEDEIKKCIEYCKAKRAQAEDKGVFHT